MNTDIIISETDFGKIAVYSPFNPDFVKAAKRLGGKWSGDTKAWLFDARDRGRVEDLLATCYGYTVAPSGELATVRIVLDEDNAGTNEVFFVGRCICWRRGRALPVKIAEEVVIIDGEFPASAGSVRYPAVIRGSRTVTIEVRDVPVEALAAEKELHFERIDADTQAQREALIAERERLIARLAQIDEALND